MMHLKSRKMKRNKKIEEKPIRYLGYFPIKNIYDCLQVSKYVDFSLSDIMQALIYAYCVKPSYKFVSYHDAIPHLYGYNSTYSDSQLESALEIIGSEYERIVEIFTYWLNKCYDISTSITYVS